MFKDARSWTVIIRDLHQITSTKGKGVPVRNERPHLLSRPEVQGLGLASFAVLAEGVGLEAACPARGGMGYEIITET